MVFLHFFILSYVFLLENLSYDNMEIEEMDFLLHIEWGRKW